MKYLILVLAFSVSSVSLYSQKVIKMKSTAYSTRSLSSSGNWSDWSNWEKTEVLMVLKNERITIYSKRKQEYDIIKYYDEYVDSDGDSVLKLQCVDQDGDMCHLRIINRKSGKQQLYVDFSNINWVYNFRKM
ncbi:MAG: hypothetical protein AAFV95_06690 [Bacteroidota bacterium]